MLNQKETEADLQKSLEALRVPDLLWRREKRPFLLRKRLILARLAAGHVPASLPSPSQPECPRTPSRCSFPELTASKHLYPAWQIKCAYEVTSPCSQSENERCAAEERRAGGEGRASESQALHPGWGGPASASVQTLWLSDSQKTGTHSLDSEMVHCKKRYCEAPFFYKYLSLSHSLSSTLTLCLPLLLVWMGPLRGPRTDPETMWRTSQGHFSDYSSCVNLSIWAWVARPEDNAQGYTKFQLSRSDEANLAEDWNCTSKRKQHDLVFKNRSEKTCVSQRKLVQRTLCSTWQVCVWFLRRCSHDDMVNDIYTPATHFYKQRQEIKKAATL